MNPEKWYIIRNDDNYKEVNTWFNENHKFPNKHDEYFCKGCAVAFPFAFGDRNHSVADPERFVKMGYTKITIEQFREITAPKPAEPVIIETYQLY